jgi:hypothetical protein
MYEMVEALRGDLSDSLNNYDLIPRLVQRVQSVGIIEAAEHMGFPPSAYNGWVARNYFSSLRPVAFFKARSRARSRNSGWLENELRSVCHPASKRPARAPR